MNDKLREIENRYRALEDQLSDPEVYGDPPRMAALSREQKRLAPIVECSRALEEALKGEAEAVALSADPDPEMREMARLELEECREARERLNNELRILLLPRDENEDKNIIIEIRGGVGGDEAALFAAALWRMYSMYAERKGFRYEILSINETELGGIKELQAQIEGDGVYSRFKFESGGHRVQRVPDTEAQGRIHTSAATVAVLPEAEEAEVDIRSEDLDVTTCRASGAGGQHVNKTDSAIRIVHKPTGLVVECQDERSQHKNRDKAMKVLRAKLYELKQRELDEVRDSERRSQVGSGDRSGRIRTYNFPQGRLTDHRIGLTLYKLDAVMNGDLDETIDALITAERLELLGQSGDGA